MSIALIILVSIVLLGVLSVILAKCKIRKDKKSFDDFISHLEGLTEENLKDQEAISHIQYILENYKEVSNIARESLYKDPILKFGTSLSFQNPMNIDLIPRIEAERVEFEGEKKRENKRLTLQFFNPFILLYRGVEIVMNFVFGYIISKFNPDFNPEKSAVWKVLNIIITVFGSVASIISLIFK